MTERKGTQPYIARTAGEGPVPVPPEPGIEHKHIVGPETGFQEQLVTLLKPSELLELKQYLDSKRIDIGQKNLQKGIVTAGYAQFGVIELADGRIAFRPNQNNYIITGTPKEFLEALKTIETTL